MATVSQLQGEITMIKKISTHIHKTVQRWLKEGRRCHRMYPVLSAALDVPHLLLQVHAQQMPRISDKKAYPLWLRAADSKESQWVTDAIEKATRMQVVIMPWEDGDPRGAVIAVKVDLFKGKEKCLEYRVVFLPDGSYGGSGFIQLPDRGTGSRLMPQ